MKILVIGDGALGTAIAQQAGKCGHEIFQTSRKNQQLIAFDLKDEHKFTNLPEADWAVIAAGISGYKNVRIIQNLAWLRGQHIKLCLFCLSRTRFYSFQHSGL